MEAAEQQPAVSRNKAIFKVFFSLGLFAFSFFIPKIIKRIRGEAESSP